MSLPIYQFVNNQLKFFIRIHKGEQTLFEFLFFGLVDNKGQQSLFLLP